MIFSKIQNNFIVSLLSFSLYASAMATVNVGILLGFTGPIERLTPDMAKGAELAIKEANDSGYFFDNIKAVPGDSTCVDSWKAVSAAEALRKSNVKNIVGADCSGVTRAVYQNVIYPNKMIMISPSATLPEFSQTKYKDLFRTAVSDAKLGAILAEITKKQGIKSVVISYVNNSYGLGMQKAYITSAKNLGIKVSSFPHEQGQPNYLAHLLQVTNEGAEALIIIGSQDGVGKNILLKSLSVNAFDHYFLSDGLRSLSLAAAVKKYQKGETITVVSRPVDSTLD